MSKHRRMLALTAAAAVVLGTGFIVSQGTASAATPPAPAGVTRADVIAYLKSLTGRNALSGQQGGSTGNPAQWVTKVHDITGQYPGLFGGDFGFSQGDISSRQTMINQVRTEWANGTLSSITMHACRPDVATCDFEGGSNPVKGSKLSSAEWTSVVTGGTSLNNAFKAKLDQFVPYFQQLKDAGIPVMFRPLHELNEGWAWWGGNANAAAGSAKLYQVTHDYLESKGLNNIIYVWAPKDTAGGASSVRSYYPGDAYVDVVALDVWVNKFPSADWYDALASIAGTSKPMALAEVGSVPQPSQMNSQPKWVYWSVWMDWLTMPDYNSNASIQAGYYDARTFNQGEIQIPTGNQPTSPPPTGNRTGSITGVGGKCIDVASAGTANGTAVQLYDCNGSTAQQWTVGTDSTIRSLGKCLDVTGQGTTNGSKIQIWDCNGSGAQLWTQTNGHLRNPQSGRDLDVPGGTTANNTRLQIWDTNTNAWQAWHLPA